MPQIMVGLRMAEKFLKTVFKISVQIQYVEQFSAFKAEGREIPNHIFDLVITVTHSVCKFYNFS